MKLSNTEQIEIKELNYSCNRTRGLTIVRPTRESRMMFDVFLLTWVALTISPPLVLELAAMSRRTQTSNECGLLKDDKQNKHTQREESTDVVDVHEVVKNCRRKGRG
jgi:hypothetical protein